MVFIQKGWMLFHHLIIIRHIEKDYEIIWKNIESMGLQIFRQQVESQVWIFVTGILDIFSNTPTRKFIVFFEIRKHSFDKVNRE